MSWAPGMTIAELHELYRCGTSPADVLARIYDALTATRDPGIFITLRPIESALADVRALPSHDPARFSLWGIPIAVKDNINVAGLPTTCACPEYAFTPSQSATAVARLVAAGAIVIGKTNLDQFATGLVGVRTPYPIPRNTIDPALVPGGSSSGSAVAVARGLVPVALGTDTAGSGRVPAGLNNIVGMKPSVGAISSVGMIPACRTLDCISVFAGTVDDAWRVYTTMAGADANDPFSRPVRLEPLGPVPPHLTLAVPREQDRKFFGDKQAAAAFDASLDRLQSLGARLEPIDMEAFYEAAAILYERSWIAERHAALKDILAKRPSILHSVTRGIVEGATRFCATDVFEDLYRLTELRAVAFSLLAGCDALVVPTTPYAPTLADLAADPLRPNAELGTYTNFVNLLDLAAVAVPGAPGSGSLTRGITFIGPRGSDARLAAIGRAFHHASKTTIGATGRKLPPPAPPVELPGAGLIEIAVVGAHLSGMPLNAELVRLGGRFLRAVGTEPSYRLYALPGGPPRRPGLLRVEADGSAIDTEVWAMPPEGFARFVSAIPEPLGIGTLRLADGTRPKGFLVESAAVAGARDISTFGGWRKFAETL